MLSFVGDAGGTCVPKDPLDPQIIYAEPSNKVTLDYITKMGNIRVFAIKIRLGLFFQKNKIPVFELITY